MRYRNWDVLLFPGTSRVPIQEFDTKYHVLPCQGTNLINSNVIADSEKLNSPYESIYHVPILTAFISSLEHNMEFRVSIHSWEPPQPSRVLANIIANGEQVLHEARVYIDGKLKAQKIFTELAIWPEVVDLDMSKPKSGVSSTPLQFPEFHHEILDEAHWDASETFGRIRIVIAEGILVSGADSDDMEPGFDRLRDVVTFSFQHAPKHILEYSGIAWPNARMLRKVAPKPPGRLGNLASRLAPPTSDFEAHAHSPQRDSQVKRRLGMLKTGKKPTMTGITTQQTMSITSAYDDPFIEPATVPLHVNSTRNSSNDVSMPDYASIRTAISHLTDMSGVSYRKVNFQRHMDEAAIAEIVEALGPNRCEELITTLSPNKGAIAGSSVIDRNQCGTSKDPPLDGITCVNGNDITGKHQNERAVIPSANLAPRSGLAPPPTPDKYFQLHTGVMHNNTEGPLLPTSWQEAKPSISGIWRNNTAMLPEMLRPRSSSNSSKRKRGDLPAHCLSRNNDLINIPNMSTSPQKQGGTPRGSNKNGGEDGGVSLVGSK